MPGTFLTWLLPAGMSVMLYSPNSITQICNAGPDFVLGIAGVTGSCAPTSGNLAIKEADLHQLQRPDNSKCC